MKLRVKKADRKVKANKADTSRNQDRYFKFTDLGESQDKSARMVKISFTGRLGKEMGCDKDGSGYPIIICNSMPDIYNGGDERKFLQHASEIFLVGGMYAVNKLYHDHNSKPSPEGLFEMFNEIGASKELFPNGCPMGVMAFMWFCIHLVMKMDQPPVDYALARMETQGDDRIASCFHRMVTDRQRVITYVNHMERTALAVRANDWRSPTK